MRALTKDRAQRFDSVASFVSVLLGEGVKTQVGPAGSPVVHAAAAVQARPRSGTDPSTATPAVTTFSRATGEMRAPASDEAPLAVARSRRWPLVALGGLVGVGLAIFLLMRPSQDAALRAGPAATSTIPAAHPASAPTLPREGAVSPSVSPSLPDAGVAAPSSAAASPIRKPSAAAPGAARALPTGERSSRRPVRTKKSAEDEWVVH